MCPSSARELHPRKCPSRAGNYNRTDLRVTFCLSKEPTVLSVDPARPRVHPLWTVQSNGGNFISDSILRDFEFHIWRMLCRQRDEGKVYGMRS